MKSTGGPRSLADDETETMAGAAANGMGTKSVVAAMGHFTWKAPAFSEVILRCQQQSPVAAVGVFSLCLQWGQALLALLESARRPQWFVITNHEVMQSSAKIARIVPCLRALMSMGGPKLMRECCQGLARVGGAMP